VDGYWVDIQDRIVLRAAFIDESEDIGLILQQLNVGNAQFFTNALDTRTRGLDVIVTHTADWARPKTSRLTTSLAGNFNRMELGEVKPRPAWPTRKTSTSTTGKNRSCWPRPRAARSTSRSITNWAAFGTNLRFVRFSSMELVNWHYYDDDVTPAVYTDRYDARVTTDLALSFDFTDKWASRRGRRTCLTCTPTATTPTTPSRAACGTPYRWASAAGSTLPASACGFKGRSQE
jgi:iron complex outermembrane receptor protein